jgi:phosphoglycolate phosphatase-like HAD superfamily hydrolase
MILVVYPIAIGYTDQYSSIGSLMIVAGPRVTINAAGDTRHWTPLTTSGDVDIAKPQPDIIQVALDRAGVTAEKAVFIGDAVWDVEACLRATVPCIGVLTGGAGRAELRNAGATAVFEDPRELLEHLEETRLAELAC